MENVAGNIAMIFLIGLPISYIIIIIGMLSVKEGFDIFCFLPPICYAIAVMTLFIFVGEIFDIFNTKLKAGYKIKKLEDFTTLHTMGLE